MKFKKLLAGVLSATMVATMIPASVAMSTVSAEDVTPVASYDLTTSAGRADWTAYTVGGNGATYTEGNDAITTDSNGVTFTAAGANAYGIDNPLKGQAGSGYTIVADISIPEDQNLTQYEGLFGFNNHEGWNYYTLTNNGSLKINSATAHDTGGATAYYFDAATSTDTVANTDTALHRYALTVDTTTAKLYVDGVLKYTYTDYNGYENALVLGAADGLNYFHFGLTCSDGSTWNWWNSTMTATKVDFYAATLDADQVSALGVADQPVAEDDEINVALTANKTEYEIGDTVTLTATATGNVALGGYQFDISYDNTNLTYDKAEDSFNDDSTALMVTNDNDGTITVVYASVDGSNAVSLGDTATELFTLSFTANEVTTDTDVTFSAAMGDTGAFAYYDGVTPTAYDASIVTFADTTATIKAASTVTYDKHDYNKDGTVDVNDVMLLAQAVVNGEELVDTDTVEYNVSQDTEGTVNVLDVMALTRLITG